MPSQGGPGSPFAVQDYGNWQQYQQGMPPPYIDDRFRNGQAPNNLAQYRPLFQCNQMQPFIGQPWGQNGIPYPQNNFQQNFYNRFGWPNNGNVSGQPRRQHHYYRDYNHGEGGSRSRPHSGHPNESEHKCCICGDVLQNCSERGIHMCDGGKKYKEKDETSNFNVSVDDIDGKLESLLQQLKGCLRNKYESVTESLEKYVSNRIDEVSNIHKDVQAEKVVLEKMKVELETKSAELEKKEKDLRAKETDLKKDRKKFDNEIQQEKEEICRQWQQLRDEIDRMETLHEVQKGRVKLDIGGTPFTTSKLTLTRDSESMLAAMFSGRHFVQVEEDGTIFIDRDGTHFRYILNYLRDGGIKPDTLPRNRQVLRELRNEAIFYQLHGLVQQIEKLI